MPALSRDTGRADQITEALDHLEPTRPEAVLATYAVHSQAFRNVADQAWKRVIAIVVQPGVEFGH